MSREIIRCDDLSKYYGSAIETRVHALKNINLTIFSGEYVALCGPSGSGKSSLMHILGCLDKPTSGNYYLCQEAVELMSLKQLALIRSKKIGFVFQQFFMMPHLSVVDNVALPLVFQGVEKALRREKALTLLQQVGIYEKHNKMPNELSGGQRQRVVIARALISEPEIILADEPTGNLDTETGKIIVKLFESLINDSRTLILITHDINLAKRTQRIVYLLDGKIAKDEKTK